MDGWMDAQLNERMKGMNQLTNYYYLEADDVGRDSREREKGREGKGKEEKQEWQGPPKAKLAKTPLLSCHRDSFSISPDFRYRVH
jgi:hypothetical protein